MHLKDSRVLITGGNGFLGKHVVKELKYKGINDIITPTVDEYDLRVKSDIVCMLEKYNPNSIIHLAATVGGIGANMKHPGRFFYDNAIMGIELIEEARKNRVEKFVCLGTICAYPKYASIPFKEQDLWDGYPEETNAPYGLAKKMLLVQLQAYKQEYNFNGIYLLPVNLYGPGDNYDPESSHVIPAIIKKCIDAKELNQKSLSVWGSGQATREFLFVKDAAEAIVLALENYDKGEPVNIGAGFEISIKELVELIADLTGYSGKLSWDLSKPDGQPRRMLDTSRAFKEFGFKAKTSFKEGLKKTIAEYLKDKNKSKYTHKHY